MKKQNVHYIPCEVKDECPKCEGKLTLISKNKYGREKKKCKNCEEIVYC